MLMRYEFDALPLDTKYQRDDAIQSQLRAIIHAIGLAATLERVAAEGHDYVSENWLTGERAEIDALENLANAIEDAAETFEDATDAA